MPQKLVLFAANGDSIAETPGSLWDLLANAGTMDADFDAQGMTVLIEDGASQRAMSLGPALRQSQDDGELQRTIDSLEARAAGYTRLASWLREQSTPTPEPEEAPDPIMPEVFDDGVSVAVGELTAKV